MAPESNSQPHPTGRAIDGWNPRPFPPHQPWEGLYCRLEPLSAERHGPDLYAAYTGCAEAGEWMYLPKEPPADPKLFAEYLQKMEAASDPQPYAIINKESGKPVGTISLMRIDTINGVVEIGHVVYSPAMRHSRIGTEAPFLLLYYVFDLLGYRRCEWKCDSFNEPSRRAALRLGFSYEGTFRNAIVYKGRNRDTAWFSIIDTEWPQLHRRFLRWLSPENFSAEGQQLKTLAEV